MSKETASVGKAGTFSTCWVAAFVWTFVLIHMFVEFAKAFEFGLNVFAFIVGAQKISVLVAYWRSVWSRAGFCSYGNYRKAYG